MMQLTNKQYCIIALVVLCLLFWFLTKTDNGNGRLRESFEGTGLLAPRFSPHFNQSLAGIATPQYMKMGQPFSDGRFMTGTGPDNRYMGVTAGNECANYASKIQPLSDLPAELQGREDEVQTALQNMAKKNQMPTVQDSLPEPPMLMGVDPRSPEVWNASRLLFTTRKPSGGTFTDAALMIRGDIPIYKGQTTGITYQTPQTSLVTGALQTGVIGPVLTASPTEKTPLDMFRLASLEQNVNSPGPMQQALLATTPGLFRTPGIGTGAYNAEGQLCGGGCSGNCQ